MSVDAAVRGFVAGEDAKKRPLIAYTFDELKTASFPTREALLCHEQEGIFRAGHMVEVYAPRGYGKSLFRDGLALAIASGGSFLRWHAPEPRGVLIVDGELPGYMVKERLLKMGDQMGITSCPLLTVIGADWQEEPLGRVDAPEGMAAIHPFATMSQVFEITDDARIAVTVFAGRAESDASSRPNAA